MKKKIIPLLVAGTALIAGCDQKATDSTSATPAIVKIRCRCCRQWPVYSQVHT